MSRIGKKIIDIPQKTEITVSGTTVSVKGPKGSLQREFPTTINFAVADTIITLTPKAESDNLDAVWGTTASHVTNMIKGVTESFTKKLIVEGIGYKAEVKGSDLVLSLGFSHQIKKPIPQTLKVTVDKSIVTINGLDKEVVGQFSAEIRALKKPEPYKGKGIRYDKEVIRRKQGKKSA